MKILELTTAVRLLASIALDGLKPADKGRVLRTWRRYQSAAEEFMTLRDEAVKRLKPEGWDDLAARADALKPAEKERYEAMKAGYEKEVNTTLAPDLEKEYEPEGERLDRAVFDALLDANPSLKVYEIDILDRAMAKQE